MKKMLLVLLCIVALMGYAMAQNPTYAPGSSGGLHGIDKLGAHNNGGRGCAGCHAPHNGSLGAGGNAGTGTGGNTAVDTKTGYDALWGQDLGPLYGYQFAMGENDRFVETLPTTFGVADEEIRGIMMCLSCHDGNIAKGAMMTNVSWEKKNNLLPPVYGPNPIPTLLGNNGVTAAGNYNNQHPVGTNATLGALNVATRFTVTTCGTAPNTYNCLTTTDAAYLQFMANYGAPSLIPGRTSFIAIPASNPVPAAAFVVCTTCHTPHTMYTYSASNTAGGKIAGLTSGVFPSYFFINAPYNPGSTPTPQQASSATQFCRQCHFSGAGGSNEASGIMNVTTAF